MKENSQPLHPVAGGLEPPAEGLASYPPVERWDDWTEYDAASWPKKVARRYSLIPTICFISEQTACGLAVEADRRDKAVAPLDLFGP